MNANIYGLGFVSIIIGLVEVAKRAGLSSRYAPVLAIVLGVLGGFAIKSDPVEAVFFGVAAGLSSCGLYSGARATFGD